MQTTLSGQATGRVSRVALTPVADLHASDENPRTITAEAMERLKRALEADPAMLRARPVIALPDGTVVAGNMRLRAAQELGWKKIPAVRADLDRERARLWMLRDNQEYGEWEEDALAGLLAELAAGGADLELTGFDRSELAELLATGKVRETDPDDAPPLPAEPESKPGEIYQLGEHRLMCGDATDPEQVAELFAGEVAGLMWTDPPYGVAYTGRTIEALTFENDARTELDRVLGGAWAALTGRLEAGAHFYCASPGGLNHLDFLASFDRAGWRVHQMLVWVKDVFVLGHSDYHYAHEYVIYGYHPDHEDVIYGYAPGGGRPGRGSHNGSRWHGDHAQSSVLMIPRPKASREHPTMKPVELVQAGLRNSSRGGDLVCDLFAGSGTTLIACEALGRRCLAMDIDPRYCDVVRQRFEEFAGG